MSAKKIPICIPSEGIPFGSDTVATILGGITIWNLWSNKSDVNLEDSACTVQTRVLLFFSIVNKKLVNCSPMATQYK